MPTSQTCYGSSRPSSFWLAVLFTVVVTSTSMPNSSASASTSNPTPANSTKAEILSGSAQQSPPYRPDMLESVAGDIKSLRDELYQQGKIVVGLEQRIEAIDKTADRVQGYLTGLIILGLFIGILGFIRSERRTNQLHEIAVAGETASQGRVEQTHVTLLDASQKTLNLVNDTLALAKEASGRAAETMKRKAEESLAEIDTAARELIDRIHAIKKFKSTIEDSRIRKEILKAAGDLATREGYIQAQDVKLTAVCYFIKGVKAYDEGQSHVAEAHFQKAADTLDLTARVLALFWRGYVFNNIGDFDRALECFTRARDVQPSGTAWYFDLRRILIETQFFANAKKLLPDSTDVKAVVGRAEGELQNLEKALFSFDERQPVIDRLNLLRGNVNVWAYSQTKEKKFLDTARIAFGAVEKGDLWASFGQASSGSELGEEVSGGEWSTVADMCRRELRSRGEPRHLALLTLTRLYIASYSKAHARDSEETMDRLQQHLRDTDDSEWLYSQGQKRNVPRNEFMTEAEAVFTKAKRLRDA